MKRSIRTKLLTAFGVIIIVMIGLGLYATLSLKALNEKAYEINVNWLPGIDRIHSADTAVTYYRTLEFSLLGVSDSSKKNKIKEELAKVKGNIDNIFAEYEKTISDDKNRKMFNKMKSSWESYYNISKQITSMGEQERSTAIDILTSTSANQYKTYDELSDELIKYNSDNGAKAGNDGQKLFKQSSISLIIVIILLSIASLGAALTISKNIIKAIKEILRVSRKVAGGDLSESVKVTSKDELGLLAEEFNTMVSNLKALITDTVMVSHKIASSSGQLSASSEEVSASAQEVANTINQMAEGSAYQAQEVDAVSANINGMAEKMQQVAYNVEHAASTSEKVLREAEQGSKESEHAVTKIDQVQQVMSNNAIAVQKLGEESKKIGLIVDVIKDIAEQTNLLALNAAIEAARAGEQGRGFAVVAEEVRKLAEQSSSSSQEIFQLISSIHNEVNEVTKLMSDGTAQISDGVLIVRKAGDSFRYIVEEVGNVTNEIKQVSEAANQMSENSRNIVSSIESISAISEQNAASTQEISASAEEQNAATEEITSSSQELERIAEELQTLVAKFKC